MEPAAKDLTDLHRLTDVGHQKTIIMTSNRPLRNDFLQSVRLFRPSSRCRVAMVLIPWTPATGLSGRFSGHILLISILEFAPGLIFPIGVAQPHS